MNLCCLQERNLANLFNTFNKKQQMRMFLLHYSKSFLSIDYLMQSSVRESIVYFSALMLLLLIFSDVENKFHAFSMRTFRVKQILFDNYNQKLIMNEISIQMSNIGVSRLFYLIYYFNILLNFHILLN